MLFQLRRSRDEGGIIQTLPTTNHQKNEKHEKINEKIKNKKKKKKPLQKNRKVKEKRRKKTRRGMITIHSLVRTSPSHCALRADTI
jgi:outer membrane biosynthesis protein TonB